MILFEEALNIIREAARILPTEQVELQASWGRVLAEDIIADMNMPPFDKAAVDGYACRREDLSNVLEVIDIVPAGKESTGRVKKNQCVKVMTGGMIPIGADTVIMIEQTEMVDENHIRFTGDYTATNICYMAEDVRAGSMVVKKGSLIRPQEIAVLAMFGYSRPLVFCRPSIGIVATGDELVEPDIKPLPMQIRNTNAAQLIAQSGELNIPHRYYGIIRDNPKELKKAILKALDENEILLLTGGVSVGEYDFVPEVLKSLGTEILFKNIAIQPGRPTLFGILSQRYVFGLPGNPVSSFIQFELLVKPLIYWMMGHPYQPRRVFLPMAKDYNRRKADRKSVVPVNIKSGCVEPVEYHGSAHISAFCNANGFLIIHEGQLTLKKGELADVRLL